MGSSVGYSRAGAFSATYAIMVMVILPAALVKILPSHVRLCWIYICCAWLFAGTNSICAAVNMAGVPGFKDPHGGDAVLYLGGRAR